MKGLYQHLTNKKASWGAMERVGFGSTDPLEDSFVET